ncbi:MAG: hypothetical protein ACLFQY_03780 [Desulfococcaceae bacterium]
MLKWTAAILLTFCLMLPARAAEIRYCEPISDEDGQWRYPDENAYHQEMIIQAERMAVKDIFQTELSGFESAVVDRGSLIDALTNFLAYEQEIVRGEAEKDYCAVLKDPRKQEVPHLFSSMEIGRVCHFDDELRAVQAEEIRNTFISDLRGKETISAAVLSMMEDPTNINMKTDEQLSLYIHEKHPEKADHAVSEAQCTALYVIPMELYAASSKREVSSIVSVMPAIETRDQENRKGEFQLVVIEKKYHWIRGSEQKIAEVGDIANFTAPFRNENFQDFVTANFRDIICIGMASCEGDIPEENRRGKIRSANLISRLREAFEAESGLDIYGLNLGKHELSKEECRQLSDEARNAQRIVMLVGVTKRSDPKVNVEAALRKAMKRMADSKQDLLPINPEDYLLFDLTNTSEES